MCLCLCSHWTTEFAHFVKSSNYKKHCDRHDGVTLQEFREQMVDMAEGLVTKVAGEKKKRHKTLKQLLHLVDPLNNLWIKSTKFGGINSPDLVVLGYLGLFLSIRAQR